MTADTVAIRLATASDADAIATLLADAFAEFEPHYTPGGFRATTPTPAEIARRITDGPIWIVESGTGIAGTVSAVRRPDGVHVRSMAVAPGARGLGIGRLLLDQVQSFADAHACDHLYLSTTPFLSQAIKMYERAGFVPTSAPPYELFGTPLFTMRKWSKSVVVE